MNPERSEKWTEVLASELKSDLTHVELRILLAIRLISDWNTGETEATNKRIAEAGWRARAYRNADHPGSLNKKASWRSSGDKATIAKGHRSLITDTARQSSTVLSNRKTAPSQKCRTDFAKSVELTSPKVSNCTAKKTDVTPCLDKRLERPAEEPSDSSSDTDKSLNQSDRPIDDKLRTERQEEATQVAHRQPLPPTASVIHRRRPSRALKRSLEGQR